MNKMIKFLVALRSDVLLLLSLFVGLFIQGFLFLVHLQCSPWPMWMSFGGMLMVLAIYERSKLISFLRLTFVALLLTSWTFSYTAADTIAYHFPMQDLLRNGWNPVYTATIEDFQTILNGRSISLIHACFLPRLTALCGALVGASTGLFVADSFLGYVLVISLLATSYGFARRFWGIGGVYAALFSACIAFTTKCTCILTGLVDYTVYAGVMIMVLSGVLYFRERCGQDLLLFVLAFLTSALSKSTGLVVGVLFGVIMAACLRTDRRFWTACGLVAAGMLVIGFSPLITSWIHYGCPLYPTMSFTPSHPPIDITADFTGNADAMRMGYLARACYAWLSPWLATNACAYVYGRQDFAPEFYVFEGVEGFGTAFRFMLALSVAALAFSRKNAVTWLCAFLFVTTLITPLKYIGFSRYFPQVWAIPSLACFNLLARPIYSPDTLSYRSIFRVSAVFFPVTIALFCILRLLAFNGRCLAVESRRQLAIDGLSKQSKLWRASGSGSNSYALHKRLAVSGLRLCSDTSAVSDAPALSHDIAHIWAAKENACEDAKQAYDEFFLLNSPMQILRFPWFRAYASLPKVLWCGF